MSAARRSSLTATAAGALLGALWFVPSANATADRFTAEDGAWTSTTSVTRAEADTSTAGSTTDGSDSAARHSELADTGSFDTTPYVVGGALFLSVGAGFVMYSVRRERSGAY